MNNKQRHFPGGFYWGASTSAHQIEGGLTNDWSAWEQSMDRIEELKKAGKDPEEFISGAACESFDRTEQDIDCLKQLGVNAYRFSIEWSRVFPERGKLDQAALEHYRNFIKRLREEGIEPFVTLWHWPVPLWVRDQGRFENKGTIGDFVEYVETVVKALKDQVRFWVTLNEPLVYASNSYLTGQWPPQKKKRLTFLKVVWNLMKAHRAAYKRIKRIDPKAQAGIASHNIHFAARQPLGVNQLIAKTSTYLWNDWLLNRIKRHQDFIGLNYYFHNSVDFQFGEKDAIYSDLGWELNPEGLGGVLRGLKKYDKPVYILEHGLADKDDKHRSWYLKESLHHAHAAMEDGVDLRGYFHWSLIDNFEWADGFFPRFGLFEVDFETCKRIPRDSVKTYAQIIRENGLSKNK